MAKHVFGSGRFSSFFLIGLVLLGFCPSNAAHAAPNTRRSKIIKKIKKAAEEACEQALAKAPGLAEKVGAAVGAASEALAGPLASAIETFAPAEAIQAKQALVLARLAESQKIAKQRGVGNKELVHSIANSSMRSGAPIDKLYDYVFELAKLPEDKIPSPKATFAILRLSALYGVEATATYDAMAKLVELQGEEADLEITVGLTQLSVAYSKSPEAVWSKFTEVKAKTTGIAAAIEANRKERAAGMSDLEQLLSGGLQIGEASEAAPDEIVAALTEACLAKGMAPEEAADRFLKMYQYDRVSSYTMHEQISLFKALVFRNRAVEEGFAAVQKVEALAKEILGNALVPLVEKPVINLVLLTGMPPEDAIKLVKSLMDSVSLMSDQWQVSALFNHILIERDRSPETVVEAAFPL